MMNFQHYLEVSLDGIKCEIAHTPSVIYLIVYWKNHITLNAN